MSHRIGFPLALVLLVACNCSSSSSKPATQNIPETGASAASAERPMVDADPREAALAKSIGELLASEHVRKRPIDDALSREAFPEYLKRLDPGKLFLLASDVDVLGAHAETMDDELQSGDLRLAREGAALIAERRNAVAGMVEEILARPLDFTDHESLETDAEKRDYAADESALRDLWRRSLELQVLERIARMDDVAKALSGEGDEEDIADAGPAEKLGDIPPTFEGREAKAREDLAKSYAGRFSRLSQTTPLEPAENFLNAIAAVYDPHTLYLAPADKENFDISMSGSLEGIGAVLSEDDHYIMVREIVPGGASWRDGKLEAGDLILAVAQDGEETIDVADMRIDEVVKMIRGPKGSVVTLTVKKPDEKVEVISITRDVVVIEAAYARGAVLKVGPRAPAVGYIYLPSFYGNTGRDHGTVERTAGADVEQLLGDLRKRKVDAVVLDLRGNGGGLLDQARDIAGLFIPTGPVVETRFSNGESQVVADEDPSVGFEGPVIVLVDRFSASASEIVAGALQDYERALIVGTGPTHGKGTVQMLVDLDRVASSTAPLGVLKLTIQQYFRVDGDSTQWRGVVPDVVLPDPAAYIESGERSLDHSIPWSKIDPLDYETWKKAKWDVDSLVAKSLARQKKIAAFEKIAARSAFLDARQDETIVPLEKGAWLARREADEKALEAVDPKLSDGKARFSVNEVDYNGKKTIAGDKKTLERLERWRTDLAHDPWIEESLRLAADMARAK